MYTLPKIERFNQDVLSKYHIYNSVFITLPFDSIDNTGVLLPIFSELCDNGFKKQETPKEIFVSIFNGFCYSYTSFKLDYNELPLFNSVPNMLSCNEGLTKGTFDFSKKIEISV